RGTADEEADLSLRRIDPLALTGARAVEQRAQHGKRKAVSSHPVEVAVSPARRHSRFGQTRHFRQPCTRGGDWPDRAEASIGALRAHARLLHVDDVGLDLAHRLVTEPPTVEHTRREAFRDDVAHRHQPLGDFEAFGMADIERNATLAGILVVELTAHVW